MPEKILIIDDDVETLRLVGMMLQKQGFEILAASNGLQGIETAHDVHPDLIVLDVMMPDMDGFEVTKRIRSQAETLTIPILMFTAKNQVDDKVIGFEAGADDYLTKPIHPAELVAHVKSLLARSRTRGTDLPEERGYTLAIVAPRGGVGASTLALNLAISYYQREKVDVIAAELRPGHGTWATELGFPNPQGLNNLLRTSPLEISLHKVENELTRTTYGPRLLLASSYIKDISLANSVLQFEAIIRSLSQMASLVVLDLGNIILPGYERILGLCEEALVLTEPFPVAIQATQILFEDLRNIGFGKNKLLSLALVNRVRSDMQLTINQVQEQLNIQVAQLIPPAPELAFNASRRMVPLSLIQPDGLVTQQYNRLAASLSSRVNKK
jgi:CheY-like chemotaxis protein